VAALGHEVIAREIDVDEVGPVTSRERPDVALVGLGESSEHALVLIEKVVQEASFAGPRCVAALTSGRGRTSGHPDTSKHTAEPAVLTARPRG
jgi:hypothetical protein